MVTHVLITLISQCALSNINMILHLIYFAFIIFVISQQYRKN